jgi:phytanoyl-CoA hydroxylase
MSEFLTEEQVSSYNDNGYLVLENFWSSGTVSELKDRMDVILDGLHLTDNSQTLEFTKSIFTTKEDRREADDYFLESGYAIRYFWEEKAFADDKTLTQSAKNSINKIGHGLHDIDPHFKAATYETRVGKICRDLGMSVPLAVQSMYIFKQAKIGGEVCAHQGNLLCEKKINSMSSNK